MAEDRMLTTRTHFKNGSRLWLWLIPVMLLSFWLGARGLDADSVWFDEAWSIRAISSDYVAIKPLSQVWDELPHTEHWHMPGYYFTLNLWARAVGPSPAALRGLSLFAGILTLALIYRLGHEFASVQVGFYAVIFLGTSSLFILYMHELRMYSFSVLALSFGLFAYLRLLHNAPSRLDWLTFFLSVIGVLYTTYFAWMMYAVVVVYHLVLVAKTRRWWQMTGIMILAGLIALPWALIPLGSIARLSQRVRDVQDATNQALTIPQFSYTLGYLFANQMPLLALVVTVTAFFNRQRGMRTLGVLSIASVLLYLMFHAVVHIAQAGNARYFLILWPMLALMGGFGFVQLTYWAESRWKWIVPLLAVIPGLWGAAGIYTSFDNSWARRYDLSKNSFPTNRVLELLYNKTSPDDKIVLYLPDDYSWFPTRRNAPVYITQFPQDIEFTIAETAVDYPQQNAYQNVMSEIGENRRRVWLASMPNYLSTSLSGFETYMEQQNYGLCELSVDRPDLRVQLYARAPICCLDESSLSPLKRYGDGIALVGIDPLPATVDQTLDVGSAWSVAAEVPRDAYSISFQILDLQRNKVAQMDDGLAHFAYTCQTAQIPLADVPDGEYGLWAAVYDYRTQERLPGTDLVNGGVSDLLYLASFSVAHP
jgi:hypothetical protein